MTQGKIINQMRNIILILILINNKFMNRDLVYESPSFDNPKTYKLLEFLQEYFKIFFLFQKAFQNTNTLFFFFYEFCGCNSLKNLGGYNSSSRGNLEIIRLDAHAQCSCVTCKSGLINSQVQFSCFARGRAKDRCGGVIIHVFCINFIHSHIYPVINHANSLSYFLFCRLVLIKGEKIRSNKSQLNSDLIGSIWLTEYKAK